jgi:predicted phosphoribosyltransferase
MSRLFLNRSDAGRQLAEALKPYQNTADLLVLGIPRGGVPVAFEIAQALHAPLDVFIVRKLGIPSDPECAMGAIASGDVRVLNADVVTALHIPPIVIDEVSRVELKELKRRESAYRGSKPPEDIRGKTVILVDDGIATGATARAALQAIRRHKPGRLILAAPTSSSSTLEELRSLADECVALETPAPFHAVAQSYHEFQQTSDEEVKQLLTLHRSSLTE